MSAATLMPGIVLSGANLVGISVGSSLLRRSQEDPCFPGAASAEVTPWWSSLA